MHDGGDSQGFEVRLSSDAYTAWKALADAEGVTTAGLLEMLGRHLGAVGSTDLTDAAVAAGLAGMGRTPHVIALS